MGAGTIAGVGTDLVQVARVQAVLAEHGEAFIARVLTPEERAADQPLTPARLARRWAAKEAVAKALGTGIGAQYGFHDIILSHTAQGAPCVQVRGLRGHVLLSVADDTDYATATALWVRDDA